MNTLAGQTYINGSSYNNFFHKNTKLFNNKTVIQYCLVYLNLKRGRGEGLKGKEIIRFKL